MIMANLSFPERCLVSGMFGLIEAKLIDSWAYEFDIWFRSQQKYQILPPANLVGNIGFDAIGAHSVGLNKEKNPPESNPVSFRFDSFLDFSRVMNSYMRDQYGGVFRQLMFAHIARFQIFYKLRKKFRFLIFKLRKKFRFDGK